MVELALARREEITPANGAVVEAKKAQKGKINWPAVYQYMLDYCNDTTIHGFKYMGETSRPWIERIFWMVAFIISTIGCALLIAEMFDKLQTNPITVSLAERPTSIHEIAFPAVTICPEIQTSFNDTGFNFKELFKLATADDGGFNFNKLSAIDQARFQAISFVCKPEYPKLRKYSTQTGNLVEILRQISWTKWYNEQSASWNKIFGARFSKRLTPFGFCFTFNIINASDLLHMDQVSEDFYYDRDIQIFKGEIGNNFMNKKAEIIENFESYPWKATMSNQDSGLNVNLRSNNKSSEWWCSKYEGFRFFVHGTDELLSFTNRFQLQFGEVTELLIKPKMTITENDLRDYSLKRRNCFFEGEKNLRFFKKYTKYNCEQECLSNYTLKVCKCVKFNIIRDQTTKICNANEIQCFENAEDELFNGDMRYDGIDDAKKYQELTKCQCLPQCSSLKYEIELVKTNYKTHLTHYMSIASLKVFFKDNEFVPLKRFQLYGTVDFLANCGGLLGLFVGVSVLSIVEIFYYFILRLACILRNKKHDDDDNEDESDDDIGKKRSNSQMTIAAIGEAQTIPALDYPSDFKKDKF